MSRLRLAMIVLACSAEIAIIAVAFGGDDKGGGTPAEDFRNPHPIAGSFEPDDTKVADCDDQACWEQAFGNLVIDVGAKPALKELQKQMNANPAIKSGCHRIVHAMGSAGLKAVGGSVAKAFVAGDETCWSGYYHGILEWALKGVSRAEMAKKARSLCGREVRTSVFIAYQCVHGLGHGLMIHSGYDLPAALDACKGLSMEWDIAACDGGVFMENVATGEGSPIKTFGGPKWLKDSDLLWPCNDDEVVPEDRKRPCYGIVTSRVLQANGYKFAGAVKECRRAERNWIPTCFQSLGRDASGFTDRHASRIRAICARAGNGEKDCIIGASKDITSNDAGGERTVVFCRGVKPSLRGDCYEAMGVVVGGFHNTTEDRRKACRDLTGPGEYAERCAIGTQA